MLATLWRHQQRPEEALRQLDRLERLEAADNWRNEIAAEREKLQPTTLALPEREETETLEQIEPETDAPSRGQAA